MRFQILYLRIFILPVYSVHSTSLTFLPSTLIWVKQYLADTFHIHSRYGIFQQGYLVQMTILQRIDVRNDQEGLTSEDSFGESGRVGFLRCPEKSILSGLDRYPLCISNSFALIEEAQSPSNRPHRTLISI